MASFRFFVERGRRTNVTYYIDGVLRHTQTTAQPAGPNRDLLVSDSPVGALGAKRDNNRYFRGTMDEVYVFTGALNQEQVTNLFLDNTPPDGVPVRSNVAQPTPPPDMVELAKQQWGRHCLQCLSHHQCNRAR